MSDVEVVSPDEATIQVIENFYRKMQALRLLAESQIKYAGENLAKDNEEWHSRIQDAVRLRETGRPNDAVRSNQVLDDFYRHWKLHNDFPPQRILSEIIFTSLFSSFDAYLNHLLRNLYKRDLRLLHRMESKHVPLSDVLTMDREEILNGVIDKDLNSLLRNSYGEIFDILAKRFGLSTLKAFPNWAKFVEFSQRRNVIVHCDGIVSDQYLGVCKDAGFTPSAKVGQQLSVSKEALVEAIEVVAEVGAKLGQILWRNVTADIGPADAHLGNFIFELLKEEQWQLARRMGEFGDQLSELRYQTPRDERSIKVIIINHAQAAMWGDDGDGAHKILNRYNWTGSAPEFRLAVSCLREEWDACESLMRQIGANSDDMPIYGYVFWPVFRKFRTTQQFRTAFHSIFGVEFDDEVKKASLDVPQAKPEGPIEPEKTNAS